MLRTTPAAERRVFRAGASRIMLRVLLGALLVAGCSSTRPVVSVRPHEHMEIGWTPRTVFQSPSYAAWFDTAYAAYQPTEEDTQRLLRMKDSVDFMVIYGTWCSDSRREMPRFFKVMDAIKFPGEQITLIAVDRSMQVPEGIARQYGITNVPTFIVRYRGVEVGRVTESPKNSLERDIADLLSAIFP